MMNESEKPPEVEVADVALDPFKIRDSLIAYRDGRFKVKDDPHGPWREPTDAEKAQSREWAEARLEQLDREGGI